MFEFYLAARYAKRQRCSTRCCVHSPALWYRQLNTPSRIPHPERVIPPYFGDSDTQQKCARESGRFGWLAK